MYLHTHFWEKEEVYSLLCIKIERMGLWALLIFLFLPPSNWYRDNEIILILVTVITCAFKEKSQAFRKWWNEQVVRNLSLPSASFCFSLHSGSFYFHALFPAGLNFLDERKMMHAANGGKSSLFHIRQRSVPSLCCAFNWDRKNYRSGA